MEERTREELRLENEELRERLFEAEEILRAIRSGQVDALAVSDIEGERIYTLKGADSIYRILIDTMSEGAVTLSLDGTILYGNVRFEKMLKMPLAKVVGTAMIDHIPEERQESFRELLGKAKKGNSRIEMSLCCPDGADLPVSLSVNALKLDEVEGFCIVVSDLTEQKRAQEELTRYQKHLEQLVDERTAQLRKIQSGLEERVEEQTAELKAHTARLETINRELREFIFVASHDLQEPLRKIQMFCTHIRGGTDCERFDEETRNNLDRMQKSAKRMQDLIQALLGYSHVFKNPGPLNTIDLNDLIREIQTELGGLIREAGAKVRSWDLPAIEAELGQMHRLFKNLVENALKFRRDESPAIRIYGEVKDEAARIFIEDNGMGLDESHLDRIFKPFQQLHRRGDFAGTGIGLAVCRKIVEQHGGAITVESTPGVGSKFIVTLPLMQSFAGIGTAELGNTPGERTREELLLEVYKLTERLKESEEILSAIREGKIDALVSYKTEGEQVYTLKSADRGYRLLVESLDEGAVILSPGGSIYYSNPCFEKMVKGGHQKIAGSPVVEYVTRKDRVKFETLLNETRQGKAARGEIRLEAGDGALLPVNVSLSPLRLEEFRGLCLTLTDLTEQKLYMEKLERSNRELQDFASIASHDLQEPLRKIRTFGERLKEKCADSLSAEGFDYLERMQNASRRMQALIEELLNYSRVATRTAPFKSVDFNDVLRDVVNDLQVRIDETGATIEIGDIPAVEADPSQMRQLFQNLIGNALKFHGKEKPLVKIHGHIPKKTEGEFFADTIPGPYCRIFVEDNGIGFNESYAERIFAPFQRLHGRSEYEGTGIGLAICKKIVERHGGVITAKSTPDMGSSFVIKLPLKQRQGDNS